MCGAAGITLQRHQILRLPRKVSLMLDPAHVWNVIYNKRSNKSHPNVTWIPRLPRKVALQNRKGICWKRMKRDLHCGADSNMIRPWSDHELVISHPPVRRGYLSSFGDRFCIENYNIWRPSYLPKFHQMLHLPRKVTLQHHQMLRLPRKVTFLQTHQIHPDIAPATQNDSHDWSCSHMKHHLQCAEEQVSPSNVTKYRACHAK